MVHRFALPRAPHSVVWATVGVGGCCVINGRRFLFPSPAPSTGTAVAFGPLLCFLSNPGLLLRLCLVFLIPISYTKPFSLQTDSPLLLDGRARLASPISKFLRYAPWCDTETCRVTPPGAFVASNRVSSVCCSGSELLCYLSEVLGISKNNNKIPKCSPIL
jgi:hypothetical protein